MASSKAVPVLPGRRRGLGSSSQPGVRAGVRAAKKRPGQTVFRCELIEIGFN
jgi:hypothetical protein